MSSLHDVFSSFRRRIQPPDTEDICEYVELAVWKWSPRTIKICGVTKCYTGPLFFSDRTNIGTMRDANLTKHYVENLGVDGMITLKQNLKERNHEDVGWINLTQDRDPVTDSCWPAHRIN